MTRSEDKSTGDEQAELRGEGLAVRSIAGGILMGLANLVPGISGGTMLLAAGVYPQFINGIAEVSTFRFCARTILPLGCIIVAAAAAIAFGAGPVSGLVIDYRWVMYSIFIGLTLGGVPLIWAMVRPPDPTVVAASIVGIVVMATMALIGPSDAAAGSADGHPYAMYFLAGLAGASAMVLPGVSGGYLLLILGQYVAVLSAVAALKNGVRAGDWDQIGGAMHVVVPVGVGVVVGVVGVSNVIKLLLERYERATLGVLLGLLLGAVIGLWPFQQGVAPEPGTDFRGDRVALVDNRLVMERSGREIEASDYATAFFRPTAGQAAAAAGLIAAGFAASFGIARLGTGAGRDSAA